MQSQGRANLSEPLLCPIGIEGLDDILGGGLPRDRLYLLQGNPGTGKTTLALQFLLNGTARGEKCLYITLSETQEEIEQVARSHGWSLEAINIIELSSLNEEMGQRKSNTLFHPSEVELQDTVDVLQKQIEKIQPSLIAFDSLSELRLLAESPLRFRRQLLDLKQFFIGKHCTALLLDDNSHDGGPDNQLQSLAHGVVLLEKRAPSYGVERRQLHVDKLRGQKFRGGNHDYTIVKGGLRVFPRLVAAEHEIAFPDRTLKSGVAEMDLLLGGGLDVGTSNLFFGPAGTSKTTFALLYARRTASDGDKVLFFTFDESPRTICRRAAKVGLDVAPLIKAGTLVIRKIDPAELGPGEFAHDIKTLVEKENVTLVIVDSLNGLLAAMGDERFMQLHLHELLTYLGRQGITSILTLAQSGLIGTMQSPVDITYLADTVVVTRFFEADGAIKKAISVLKKRSDDHESTIREFCVDANGIRLSEPLTKFRGVLTGVPTFGGEATEMLKNRDERAGK